MRHSRNAHGVTTYVIDFDDGSLLSDAIHIHCESKLSSYGISCVVYNISICCEFHARETFLLESKSNHSLIKVNIIYMYTVNSRYIEAGYNEVPAYIEMGLSPQSTKCIHFHPFITKTRLYRRNIQVPWTSI